MSRKLLILALGFSLSPVFAAIKKKRFVVNYDLIDQDFITLHPVQSLAKRKKYLNFYKIEFSNLDADIVKTKLVDPGLVDNAYVKIRKANATVKESSSKHIIKMGRNIDSSTAYLNLETYIENNGVLELKEILPIRLNIGPVDRRLSCIAIAACGKYRFLDKEIIDYIGYTCAPGGALVDDLPMEDCL